jgi:LuxR family maltose regulon positive regulatory protein
MTLEFTELPFITRVIVPKRRGNKICRRHLLEVVKSRIDRKAQVVCAPAGYGKTSLFVDFVNETRLPVCWYSFAPEDCDPSSFLRYCLQSIRNNIEGFGDDYLALLRDPHNSDWRAQLGFFVNALQQYGADRLIFAFDDVHWVQGKRELEDAVSLFIERSPDNVHFILGSRVWPSLACLPKLAVADELRSLSTPDLRFSEDETARLLSRIWDREVSTEEAVGINSRTRGWPTAIILTARNQAATFTSEDLESEDEGILFDYLSLEIFDGLPDFLKSFLLKSSILREFTTSQCSRLFDVADVQPIIDQIRDLGLFLEERTGNGSSYAYHDLFRQFLERKFQSEYPEDYRRMHYYAAGLFSDLGDHDAGIYHYLKSGSLPNAKSIVKDVADLYYAQGQWRKLASWIDRLPQETVEEDSALQLLRGQILIRLGNPTEALMELDKLMAGPNSSDQEVLGRALTAKSTAYRRLGHLDLAITAAEEGLSTLRQTNCSQEYKAEAYKQLGDAFFTRGEYGEAKKNLHAGLELTRMANLRLFSLICNDLGVTYMELGDLDQAVMYLEKSRARLLKLGSDGPLAETLSNLALVYFHKGEFDLALDNANEAVTTAQAADYPRVLATSLMNQSIVERALSAYTDSLASASRALELSRQLLDQRLVAESTDALGNAYRLLGETSKAEVLLKQALLEAEDSGQKYITAIYNISLGKVYWQMDSYHQALEHLSKAETQLTELNSLRRVGEAKLYQAAVFYRTEKFKEVLHCLSEVATLMPRGSFDGFLLADGKELMDVLRFGAAKRVGEETFKRLVARLGANEQAPEETEHRVHRSPGSCNQYPGLRAVGLGEGTIFLDTHEVTDAEWRSQKAKELFFFLLSKRQAVSTEQITESLWPELSVKLSASTLKTTVYRLRQALFNDCILVQGTGYCINPEVSVDFDVDSFLSYLKLAMTRGNLIEERKEHLTKAVNLYNGPFLAASYSEWCEELRNDLEMKYHAALMNLASYHMNRGDFPRAIELLEEVIASDPYNEEAYYQYIQNYLKSDEPYVALQHLRKYARISVEELGTDLPTRFLECHNRILQLLPNTA